MPRKRNWKKGVVKRKDVEEDHLKTVKKTVPCGRYKTTNLCLFEDLEKTEKRLQYIQARNERPLYSDEDNQQENSSNKIADLKQEKQQMKEEIALLKLKIDVLLNMLAQATAVTNYQHDELKRLRAQIGNT